MTVRVLEHVFGVGVVRGAEGVRAYPPHEVEVMDHVCRVVPLAPDRAVLVLAEASEPEGLAVDEELLAVHLHGADADGECVHVALAGRSERLRDQLVEISRPRTPQGGIRDTDLAPSPLAPGHRGPFGIPYLDPNVGLGRGDDLVA